MDRKPLSPSYNRATKPVKKTCQATGAPPLSDTHEKENDTYVCIIRKDSQVPPELVNKVLWYGIVLYRVDEVAKSNLNRDRHQDNINIQFIISTRFPEVIEKHDHVHSEVGERVEQAASGQRSAFVASSTSSRGSLQTTAPKFRLPHPETRRRGRR